MLPKEGRITMQDGAEATGNGTVLSVIGYGAAVLQVTGTFVGTVTFEASVNESDFAVVRVVNLGTGTLSTTATAPGLFYISAAGLRLVRARVSARTSGSITVTGSVVALGSAVPGAGVYIIGSDGANLDLVAIDGMLRTVSLPYEQAIAHGHVPGHISIRRFGHNTDVGTSAETLSHIDAIMYYPTADETFIIKSDDADDDGSPAGDGARTVWIQGMNDNYEIVTDTITMNGTTAVNLNVDMFRAFKIRTVTYGDTGYNEGEITLYGADGTSKILSMETTDNESHSATYTVPAGYTAYISELVLTEASLKGTHTSLWMRPFGGPFYNKREFSLLDSPMVLPVLAPLVVPEKTDIEVRCVGIAAGAVVSGGFLGHIEEN